jgi:hypothetical protein
MLYNLQRNPTRERWRATVSREQEREAPYHFVLVVDICPRSHQHGDYTGVTPERCNAERGVFHVRVRLYE